MKSLSANTQYSQKVQLIKSSRFVDDRGVLVFANGLNLCDIGVKRFYTVQNHLTGYIRAWHGHKYETKIIVPIKGVWIIGAVELDFSSGPDNCVKEKAPAEKYLLDATNPQALCIPGGFANGLMNLSAGATCIVFSTATVDESKDDDIRLPWNFWDIWGVEYR